MTLKQLLLAYGFDELMPVINDMFPGTSKFRPQLGEAYRIATGMKSVPSKKTIRYKVIHIPNSDHSYMGAEDSCFDTTWEVCLGKEVSREKGVNLADIEIAANSLVNLCLIARGPKSFDDARSQLLRG